jgi:hypothetical protein
MSSLNMWQLESRERVRDRGRYTLSSYSRDGIFKLLSKRSPEPEFVSFCRTGPPRLLGWRNRFLYS